VPSGIWTWLGLITSPVACAVTVSVIGITNDSAAPGALTVIDPVLVPMDKFAGFTATLIVFDPSVEPVCGPTASHEPDSVDAV
jgi:hypothetical protein